MSTLVENVAKVTAAHAALKTAIASKGVAVPDGAKLTDMPALVEQIRTDPVPTNPRAVFTYDRSTSITVPDVLVVDFTKAKDLSRCFTNCSALKSLTLPDGFGQAAIGLYLCFSSCSALTSLKLPAGFGQAATDLRFCFYYCSALTSLKLPAGFGQAAIDLGNFVSSCTSLTSLELPDGFGQAATDLTSCFDRAEVLRSLTLPAGFGQAATSLAYCFRQCYLLTSLTLPDGFGQLATDLRGCFFNCTALTSLKLPDGFGQAATDLTNCFYCGKLETITGNPNFKVSLSFSSSPALTHDSIMVVINSLQTVTSSQKLTLGSTNLAKLTDEEKKIATDKGWTLA